MSERRYLTCDACGRTLPLPTTPQAAGGWSRHSRGSGDTLRFIHTCAACDSAPTLEQFGKGEV